MPLSRIAGIPRTGDPARYRISLTVLSVNYLGDGLRDALDRGLRGRLILCRVHSAWGLRQD